MIGEQSIRPFRSKRQSEQTSVRRSEHETGCNRKVNASHEQHVYVRFRCIESGKNHGQCTEKHCDEHS
jgi:hypothetical protein